jgi:hypothetical protein
VSASDALRRVLSEAILLTPEDQNELHRAFAPIAGPGRTVLIISDHAAADFVSELRRSVEAGDASPLTELLNSRMPI